jgi:hypothetical protein
VAGVAALGAALLALAAWLLFAPSGGAGGVAILGDDAPALHAAMGTAQALPVGSAAFTVVSVQGWDRLRYIADKARLCGAACAGEAGLVRAVRLSPTGSRKVVFVNLDAWPGTADPQAPERDFACLARTLATERTRLAAAPLPDCATAVPVAGGTRWVLPAGLGAL